MTRQFHHSAASITYESSSLNHGPSSRGAVRGEHWTEALGAFPCKGVVGRDTGLSHTGCSTPVKDVAGILTTDPPTHVANDASLADGRTRLPNRRPLVGPDVAVEFPKEETPLLYVIALSISPLFSLLSFAAMSGGSDEHTPALRASSTRAGTAFRFLVFRKPTVSTGRNAGSGRTLSWSLSRARARARRQRPYLQRGVGLFCFVSTYGRCSDSTTVLPDGSIMDP